jgi:outer membrane biosynthesis protein TonB
LRLPIAVLGALLVHAILILVVWVAPYLHFVLPVSCSVRPPSPIRPPQSLEIVLEGPEPEDGALTQAELEELEQKFEELPLEEQREYLDIDGLAKKKNLSKRALLESWEDSVAGTRKPGKGDSPLPSQEGRDDLPFLNFKDQKATVGDPKALPTPPQPKLPLPLEEPTPIFKPEPVAKPELKRTEPENIPKTASVETPAAEPQPEPPPQPTVVRAEPPQDIKTVKEAAEDEIPLFVLAPKLLGKVTERDLAPAPTPEPEPPKPTPTPAPEKKPTPEPKPEEKPAPVPDPKPEVKPTPTPTPKPGENRMIAMRTTSNPRPTPVPNPGYSPHMERRKIEGGNAPEGEDGVDAVASERGRYMKALNQAVGSRWTHYVRDAKQASLITAGSVTMKFALNSKGKVTRVRVIDNTSNSAHASLCERAFLESQSDIDPPPRELLRNGVFEDTFTFTLY